MTPKELALILHTFMCDYFHEDDPTQLGCSQKCEWEVEENMANKWQLPEHMKWLERAGQIMRIYPLLSSAQLRGFLELRVMLPEVYDILIKIEQEGV